MTAREYLPEPLWAWTLAGVVGIAATVYIYGPRRAALFMAANVGFWFGVYLPAGIAYDYYHSDPEERQEWREFLRGLVS